MFFRALCSRAKYFWRFLYSISYVFILLKTIAHLLKREIKIKQKFICFETQLEYMNIYIYIYIYIYTYSLLIKFHFKNLKQLFHKAFKKALILS